MSASCGQQISDPRHAVRLNAGYLRRYIQARDDTSLQCFLGENEDLCAEQCAALQSALFLACQEGFAEGVRVLLQKGADVNDSDDFGATPLHFAVFGNHPEIVVELLNAKVNFAGWNRDGETLLHWAAANGHAQVVRTLLQRGANLLAVDAAGRYAIHVACKEGHVDVVSVLIGERGRQSTSKEGVDPDKRRRRRPDCLSYNVDVVDKNGWTPLHYACTSFAPNFDQVVNLLLTNGADLLLQTRNGKTALHLAFDCGRDILFQDSLPLSQLLRLLLITDDLRMHGEDEQPDLEEKEKEEEEFAESEYMQRVRKHYSFLQDDFSRLSKRRSQCSVMSGMCPRHIFDKQSLPLIWRRIVVNDDTELLAIMRDAFCRDSDALENPEVGFQHSFDPSKKDLTQIHQMAFENGLGICSYAKGRFRKLIKQENYEGIYEVLTGHPRSASQEIGDVRLFRPLSHSVLFVALLSGRLKVVEMLVRMRQYDLLPAALVVILITRSFAREKVFTEQVQTLMREFADKIEQVASEALNHIFLHDNSAGRRASISFISEPLASFGGKSVVDLAAQGSCSYFLSLPCCQVVLYNLWEGEVRSSPLLHMAALAFFPFLPCLVPALTRAHRPQHRRPSHCMIKNFDLRTEGAIPLSRLNAGDSTLSPTCTDRGPRPLAHYLRAMRQIASYPASKFLHFFIAHVIFLVCFSYVLLYDFHCQFTALEIFCFVYIGGYAIEEVRRVCQRICGPSTVPLSWQISDVCALVMALGGFVVRLKARADPAALNSPEERDNTHLYAARLLLLTALLAFYIRTLFIFSAWRSLGPKLDMMAAMIRRDLLPMLTIFLLFLIAFGVIFQGTLFPNGYEYDHRGARPQHKVTIFFNVIRRAFYGMMAAEYDLEFLTECAQSNCTSKDLIGRNLTMFGFKVIFTLIANLILVNLLIALYSHTVAQINERSTAHWQANIYNLVAEFRNRSALPPPLNVVAILVEFGLFLLSRTCAHANQQPSAISEVAAKQFLVIQAFALKGRRYALGPSSNQQAEKLQKRLESVERQLRLLKAEITKAGRQKVRSRFDRRVVQETA